MANIIIVNVSSVKSSAVFMAIVESGKLHILKTWGKASYPIPASLVMDKDTNTLEMFKSAGIPCYDVKTNLDYPNNIFGDDKELAKLTSLVCGKSTPSPVAQAVKSASPAILEMESHEGLIVPSVLSDTWDKHNANLVNFKDLRRAALDAGMPERLTAPNPVKKWVSEKLASEAVTPSPVAQAVTSSPAVDMDMFMKFQAFMQAQQK